MFFIIQKQWNLYLKAKNILSNQKKKKKMKKKREQTKLNIISILLFLKIISSNLETSWCPTTKPRLLSTLWDVVDELAWLTGWTLYSAGGTRVASLAPGSGEGDVADASAVSASARDAEAAVLAGTGRAKVGDGHRRRAGGDGHWRRGGRGDGCRRDCDRGDHWIAEVAVDAAEAWLAGADG